MSNKIQVLIVDDHAVLRAGLHMLIDAQNDMEVVGEAADASESIELIRDLKPDIILMDISMPGSTGLEVIPRQKELSPDSRVLILTMHDDESHLRNAFNAGVSGYVLKKAAHDELLNAIRVVRQGGLYLHREHARILLDSKKDDSFTSTQLSDKTNRLSPREVEVLQMIAKGYTNKETADQLFLSIKTVETYKARLMTKLGLSSRADLVRFALQQRLME